MSNRMQKLQPGDRIKISLSGERYEVLKNDGILIKTKNIQNGYGRTFRIRDLSSQTTVIEYGNSRKLHDSLEPIRKEALCYLGTVYHSSTKVSTNLN